MVRQGGDEWETGVCHGGCDGWESGVVRQGGDEWESGVRHGGGDGLAQRSVLVRAVWI